jgi:hypothetical protein
MIKYVYSVEYIPNCPVHDSRIYSGLKKTETLDEILDFALKYLNEYFIRDIIDIKSDNDIAIAYYSETHRFNGLGLSINNKFIKGTIDDGRGNLIWEMNE